MPFRKEGFGKFARVERLEVVEPFARAKKPDGKIQLAPECSYRAAAGAAIQLGDDDAGGRHGLRKEASLLNRVLPYRAVEDEQCLVRCTVHAASRDTRLFTSSKGCR